MIYKQSWLAADEVETDFINCLLNVFAVEQFLDQFGLTFYIRETDNDGWRRTKFQAK